MPDGGSNRREYKLGLRNLFRQDEHIRRGKLRIYVDVTETFESQLNTGIQRVVRKIYGEIKKLERGKRDLKITAVVSRRGTRQKAYALEDSWTNYHDDLVVNARLAPTYKMLSLIWRRLEAGPMKRLLQHPRVLLIASQYIEFITRVKTKSDWAEKEVKFKKNDILFLPDAFWGNESGLDFAMEAKKAGCKIVLLIHDVFPLSHPELVDALNILRFKKLIFQAVDLADFIYYPSFVTRDEISKHVGDALQRVQHKKLNFGHDGINTEFFQGTSNSDAEKIPKSMFMLGTVEPRKNYELVFNWYIKNARSTRKFTIVGKPGWLTEALQARMRKEQLRNSLFTWHEDANDELMHSEMVRHEIGIMASHAEGFGLPVVEMSLSGLKLVLSDIPIFREVAGDSAVYFDTKSEESFGKALESLEQGFVATPFVVYSWTDTASQIRDDLLDL